MPKCDFSKVALLRDFTFQRFCFKYCFSTVSDEFIIKLGTTLILKNSCIPLAMENHKINTLIFSRIDPATYF